MDAKKRRTGTLMAGVATVALGVLLGAVLAGCPAPTGGGNGTQEIIPTLYVDASAALGGDGASWATAYRYLQDALYDSADGDAIAVAEGVYYPDDDEGGHVADDARYVSFVVKDGVRLYGGYPAGGGTRDHETYVSVLSGDIQQDDTVDANGITLAVADVAGGNSYMVVSMSDVGPETDLNGFTICGGSRSGTAQAYRGGGIYCWCDHNAECSPLIEHVRFCGNHSYDGGAIAFRMSNAGGLLNGRLAHVRFENNQADAGGGAIWIGSDGAGLGQTNNVCLRDALFKNNESGSGGAVADGTQGTSTMKLADVIFQENTATASGGGACLLGWGSSKAVVMQNVLFWGNVAVSGGGALYTDTGTGRTDNSVYTNVAFSGNQAQYGGAVRTYYYVGTLAGTASFVNCTWAGNFASSNGGALYIYSEGPAVLQIRNSILWGNTAPSGPQVYKAIGNNPTHLYTTIEGALPGGVWNTTLGADGGNNLAGDPLFESAPDAGDGDWASTADNDYGDLHLQAGSPALDTADSGALPADGEDLDADGNTAEPLPLDAGGGPRVQGSGLDRGAYESG